MIGGQEPELTAARRPLSTGKLAVALCLQFGVFALIGLTLWYWSGRPLADFVRLSPDAILLGLTLGGALIAAAYLGFKIFPRISERFVRMQSKTYGFLGDRLSLPMIVLISIGAGVGEEALFRGGLQTLLIDYLGPLAGILIASALFAVVHLSKPPIMGIIFAIGLLFGTIYYATGSLVLVMIAHAVYDVFALHYLMKEMRRLGCLPSGGSETLAR